MTCVKDNPDKRSDVTVHGTESSRGVAWHSTMDASQIRDGPFNFLGRVEFF